MATGPLTRNLRDGTIVIKDGTTPTPLQSTLVLDNGDLQWTEKDNTIEILDRGSISAGHTRNGDDASCELSFSTKWRHLIVGSVTLADGHVLYEMFNGLYSAYESTSGAGEKYTLKVEFSVADPSAGTATSEKITFAKVYKETIVCGEGSDANKIEFKGKSFETRPTVVRY
jgi:hypothetical protein